MSRNKGPKRPENMKQTLADLWGYLWKSKWTLAVVVVCLIVSSAAGIIGTYAIRPLINDFIATGDLAGLAKMLGFIAIVYVLGATASYFSARLMVTVGQNTIEKMRADLFNHIQSLPIRSLIRIKHRGLNVSLYKRL